MTRIELTIEHIVISFLLNLCAQSCRYRGMLGVVGNSPVASLRWLPTQDGTVPLRRLSAQNVAAPLRRLPLNFSLALLRQFPLHRTAALVRVHAGDTATSSVAQALGPAIPAAPPAGRRTGESARRTCAHGRVLALETLAAPSVGEAERVEMLFVLLLWWLAVFGPRHGLAGLVDVAGPSLMGVCGVGLGESVVVVAGSPEEGLGTSADGHCGVSLRVWVWRSLCW